MSKETTSPALKWILTATIGIIIFGAVLFFLLATYPAEDIRVAQELEARGFHVTYARQGYLGWEVPNFITGRNQKITSDDCRLICQLSRLRYIYLFDCDITELNLDDIGNCRKLEKFWFSAETQTRLPMSEIQKLSACPTLEAIYLRCNRDEEFSEDKSMDVFLEYFEKSPKLRVLQLPASCVTKEGVEEFKNKCPDIRFHFTTNYVT